jgi:hypothetical protein
MKEIPFLLSPRSQQQVPNPPFNNSP